MPYKVRLLYGCSYWIIVITLQAYRGWPIKRTKIYRNFLDILQQHSTYVSTFICMLYTFNCTHSTRIVYLLFHVVRSFICFKKPFNAVLFVLLNVPHNRQKKMERKCQNRMLLLNILNNFHFFCIRFLFLFPLLYMFLPCQHNR